MPVTRTFLFTDIEGSTRSEQQEPVAWASNHAQHNRIVEEAVLRNSGEVYKNTGDGYQAAFVNAPDALISALDIQSELDSAHWQGTVPIRIRMALHTGEAEHTQGDYLGYDLNKAARLMDAGHGGQVLLSLVTAELVRDALRRDPALAGVELRELGVYGLRGMERPERIFQLVAPGLQSSFPALRTEVAYFSNLPAELGRFIGRTEELATLREELLRTRLLTITGPGGAGKTRLALHLAREVAAQFKDGVGLVALGSVDEQGLVVQTVASVFGVRESTTSLRESLIYYLQKKAVLLIFDDCEHLLDICADFIGELLSKSAELKVVVTSRERLDIDGETVYSLPMLAVPKSPQDVTVDDVHSYAAMELFVTAAMNAGSGFTVTEQNVGKIAEICKHLDGNALAINLAASLTPTLSPDEMLERLNERFDVLVRGNRQTAPRHKTLKAAIDWSYELLSPEEATVFRRLAVFAGNWSLKAAESLCTDEQIGQSKIVTILDNLVRKNLVTRLSAESGDAKSRFGMLETIREYARIQLRQSDEAESLEHEHAKYFTERAKREASLLWSMESEVGMSHMEQDYDDIVKALEWARKTDVGKESGLGLRLAAELGSYWERRGFLSEGRERLAQALRARRRPEQDRYRAEALDAAARLAFLQNDYPEAIGLYEKSLAIRRRLASRGHDTRLTHGVVGVLNKIGLAAVRSGDYVLGEQRLSEALDLAKKTNHIRGIVAALDHLGELAWRQGDYEAAKERYQECLTYARRQTGRQKEMSTLDALIGQARILMMQERYDEARVLFTTCLDIQQRQGNKTGLAYTQSDLSEVAFRQGDYEAARRHAEESLALRQEVKNEWGIADSQFQLAQAEHMQGLHEEALRHLKESLAIFERLVYRKGIAECFMRIAAISLDLGDKETAAKLFGAAEALLDSLGAHLVADQRDYYEKALLASPRAELDGRMWDAGRDIGVEAAIVLAQGVAGKSKVTA
jgi:predicted ATPase/class 3 adenylate cyclase